MGAYRKLSGLCIGFRARQIWYMTSLVAQMVKHLSTMPETWVRSLGREDPLEKEVAAHSSTLAGKSHGQRSLVGYCVHVISKKSRHDLETKQQYLL